MTGCCWARRRPCSNATVRAAPGRPLWGGPPAGDLGLGPSAAPAPGGAPCRGAGFGGATKDAPFVAVCRSQLPNSVRYSKRCVAKRVQEGDHDLKNTEVSIVGVLRALTGDLEWLQRLQFM